MEAELQIPYTHLIQTQVCGLRDMATPKDQIGREDKLAELRWQCDEDPTASRLTQLAWHGV